MPGATVHSLQSRILAESRQYFVHLPHGYAANTSTRYPILYVLDGAAQSNHTAESAALLARVGVVPPMIVVGIPNLNRDSRSRDFTPPDNWVGENSNNGARRFLSFLETELIPKIEADYRTSRPRMLAGWSLGGLFVLYSQVASPAAFDGRFAHSPAWGDNDPTVTRIEEGLKAASPATTFLYMSLGSDEAGEMMQPFKRLGRILTSNPPPGLRWRQDVSSGGGHNSNPVLSTPVGLCAMFAPGSGQTCREIQR